MTTPRLPKVGPATMISDLPRPETLRTDTDSSTGGKPAHDDLAESRETQEHEKIDISPTQPGLPQRRHAAPSAHSSHHLYHKERVSKEAKILPFLYRPPPVSPAADAKAASVWLVHGREATEWLNLFFDLVVVAVLNVFSTNSEMKTPSSVGVFFSYFLIVWWNWTAQVIYDVRYAAEDYYHRFFKLLQVLVFVYIGAGSSGWAPLLIEKPTSPEIDGALEHLEAYNAFQLIGVAYAASRALLVVQYLTVAFLAKRAGRNRKSINFSLAAIFLSMLCVIAAVAIPARGDGEVAAKITLLYTGVAIECAGEGLASFAGGVRAPHERVSERFGCLTLIILGEGVMHTLKTFNKAISSFSNDGRTYVQVFLCVFNLYILFLLLFSRFDKEAFLGRRQLFAWLVLHFPLHFVTLCALSGFVNNVISIAVNGGLNVLLGLMNTILRDPNSANMDSVQALRDNPSLLFKLDKLDLIPPPLEQAGYIDQLVRNATSTDPQLNTAAISADVVLVQYLSQAVLSIYSKYGFDPSTEVSHLFLEINQQNTTATSDDHNEEEVIKLFYTLLKAYDNEVNELCFWLLPASGAVLIVVALVNLTREPVYYLGKVRRYALILQFLLGAALCFLGFLNNGYRAGAYTVAPDFSLVDTTRYAPIINLVYAEWALPIVTLTWTAVWAAHLVANRIAQRVERREEKASNQA